MSEDEEKKEEEFTTEAGIVKVSNDPKEIPSIAKTIKRHEMKGEFLTVEEIAHEASIPTERAKEILKLWEKDKIGRFMREDQFMSRYALMEAMRNLTIHRKEERLG